MMSDIIRQETAVFLLSVLHGIGLTFLYDLLRALRRAVPHGLMAVSFEDFLFWMAAGFLTFCLAFLYTDGVIRGYVAAGIGIGVILYHYTASRLVVRLCSGFFRLIRKMIGIFWKALSAPVRKTRQFLKKKIEFAKKKSYNNKKRDKAEGR